ncbi:hypothetical protein K1Y78_60845, partial [Streptomyces sp. tea 10]|nr:hypothetical protein [Streptomyces sp. tea 10]
MTPEHPENTGPAASSTPTGPESTPTPASESAQHADGRAPSAEPRNAQGAASEATGTNDASARTTDGNDVTAPAETAGGNHASTRAGTSQQSVAAASEREHPAGGPVPVSADVLAAVAEGRYHDPHAVLGAHFNPDGSVTIRTLRRFATHVSVRTLNGTFPLEPEWGGIFTGVGPAHDEG